MAKCIYCGQSAGLFRRQHAECARIYEEGLHRITSASEAGLTTGGDLDQLAGEILKIATESRIPRTRMQEALFKAWASHLRKALEAGHLTVQEEKALRAFRWRFGLRELEGPLVAATVAEEVGRTSAQLDQAGVLREIFEGRVPAVPVSSSLPFAFTGSEKVVWVFYNVGHLTLRRERHYEGGSSGLSVRVASGVYVRSGAFRGSAVVSTHAMQDDAGQLAVTDENVYFAGRSVAFRIPLRKIAAVIPYADGFRVLRDAVSAKPEILLTREVWFAVNLILGLAHLRAR
jgi:hypothetical protein